MTWVNVKVAHSSTLETSTLCYNNCQYEKLMFYFDGAFGHSQDEITFGDVVPWDNRNRNGKGGG